MAKVRVDYEISYENEFITINTLSFNLETPADLDRDRQDGGVIKYKSQPESNEDAYYINPSKKDVNVTAIATGLEGFEFEIKLTFTILDDDYNRIHEPYTPELPKLKAIINNKGFGIINQSVKWKKK